jgi:tRNA (guanine37-N1)-methyltransferase
MRVDFLTIFPNLFSGFLEYGLIHQAQEKKVLQLRVHDLRDFTNDRHRSVDDVSYGGGPGMVFKPEPVFQAVEAIREIDSLVILPSPQGIRFSQKFAEELAVAPQLIFLCARYEGVDERICEHLVDHEVSIGDFIVMGGELPAMLMAEAVTRLVPGVVGCPESVTAESFHESLLDFPHYTRPEDFRDWKVPQVLLSGHHGEIRRWRRKMALKRTRARRPDLFGKLELTKEDQELLDEMSDE